MNWSIRSVTVVAPCLSRGGMTRAYFLGLALQHAGYRVEIIGHLPAGEHVYPDPPAGLNVVPITGAFPGVMRRLVRRIDGDLVLTVKPVPTSYGAGLLATRWDGRPIVADIDDWEGAFRKRVAAPSLDTPRQFVRYHARRTRGYLRRAINPRNRFYLRWMERALRRADAITANTRFLQQRFGGEYIPSGKDTRRFDPEKFDPAESRRVLGLDKYFVVMFPGTARLHKGVDDIVAALKILGRPDARLVIVGGRTIGQDYASHLVDRFPDRVIHIPRQGADQMPMVVSAAHVVVVPQRDVATARAQFPIKLTDAMAMAKPIVTTPIGDIPEIVADGAWIVPPSLPDGIAGAIREIAADPVEAARRGVIARRRCIDRFSTDAVGKTLKALIDRIR